MVKRILLLKNVYICELYLINGNAPYIHAGRHIPKDFKQHYIEKMELEYDSARKKYKADYELVWKYFVDNYGTILERKSIKSLDQLMYEALG